MSSFIEGYKKYISNKKYKQVFLAKKADMDENRFSRLLTGKQDITEKDMITLSRIVNKPVEYFFSDAVDKDINMDNAKCAYYISNESKEVRILAEELKQFVESIDAIMGLPGRVIESNREE